LRPVARIVDFADLQFADLHLGSPWRFWSVPPSVMLGD
jgi:hypothetical protein